MSHGSAKSRSSASEDVADAHVLKSTCQTCFHAKIRCIRSSSSGACDRCQRLDKHCVFAPSKRPNPAGTVSHSHRRPASRSPLRRQLRVAMDSQTRSHARRASPLSQDRVQRLEASLSESPSSLQREQFLLRECPFTGSDGKGLLAIHTAEELLQYFRVEMTPNFPFVIVPESMRVEELWQQRPFLTLAILAVSSFTDGQIQQALWHTFHRTLTSRMFQDKFAYLDTLQGLLVSLAWAHYQPRPRRYSQFLHLALSVVDDMRLDRPKDPTRHWQVLGRADGNVSIGWDCDESRALLGTYYLASSSCMIMQKHRHLHFEQFFLDTANELATSAAYATDRHLPIIVELQKLFEELDDALRNQNVSRTINQIRDRASSVRNNLSHLKSDMAFPLADSPTITLQCFVLELFLSNVFLLGLPFSTDRPSVATDGDPQLVERIFGSTTVTKSLITYFLTLRQGEESGITNLSWISFLCALTMGCRLDLWTTDPSIAPQTRHLRDFLDISTCLRQVVLRLEAAVNGVADVGEEEDVYTHMLKRVRTLQRWYEAAVERAKTGAKPIARTNDLGTHQLRPRMVENAANGDDESSDVVLSDPNFLSLDFSHFPNLQLDHDDGLYSMLMFPPDFES